MNRGRRQLREPLRPSVTNGVPVNRAQINREDLRILWKQIASRHAFAHNPEYLNEGSLDALIEFARIARAVL